MLQIDSLQELVAAGVIVLLALGMILGFAMRRRIKASKGEVVIDEQEEGKGQAATLCAPYVAGHTAILARLEALAEATNVMQLAQNEALDVLLGLAEGDQINGQVKAVRRKLIRAEGFKDGTEAVGVAS
jgi:hypothetical protein